MYISVIQFLLYLSLLIAVLFSSISRIPPILFNTDSNRINPPFFNSFLCGSWIHSPLLFWLNFFFSFPSHTSALLLFSLFNNIHDWLAIAILCFKRDLLHWQTIVVVLPVQTHSFSNACDKEVRPLRDWRPMIHVSYILNNRILMHFSQKTSQQQ